MSNTYLHLLDAGLVAFYGLLIVGALACLWYIVRELVR